MAMEFNVLTSTLTAFVGALSAGQSRIQGVQGGVLRALLIIEITLAACWIALDASNVSSIFKKLLNLGFWIWFASNFSSLAKTFCDSLVQAGLTAGGAGGNFTLLLDPSAIAGQGLDASVQLVQALDKAGTFAFKDVLLFGLAYFIIMGCYILMAVQIFLAVIEYYLIVTLACVLIPFGVSPHTKFLAEKAIGGVVAMSIKLMVLAFLMSVITPTLSNVHFGSADITLNEVMAVTLTSVALAFLVWNAPSVAASLLAGSPALSAAGITQNVSAAAMMATGAIAGAVGSARSAAGALRGGEGARDAANRLGAGAAAGARSAHLASGGGFGTGARGGTTGAAAANQAASAAPTWVSKFKGRDGGRAP